MGRLLVLPLQMRRLLVWLLLFAAVYAIGARLSADTKWLEFYSSHFRLPCVRIEIGHLDAEDAIPEGEWRK